MDYEEIIIEPYEQPTAELRSGELVVLDWFTGDTGDEAPRTIIPSKLTEEEIAKAIEDTEALERRVETLIDENVGAISNARLFEIWKGK